jgi:HAD superfamily hydrolase (TIGR01509 family)
MNIIIPLGGKGERFSKNGYKEPKPLIPIFDKCMIEYVIDNLVLIENDKVFIIYNKNLENFNFSKYINSKYSFIHLIEINDTKGAVETLFLGIEHIKNNNEYNEKCLILDCDTFYTENIREIFNQSNDNMVFYTKNYDKNPIYSYIELNNESKIINIKEKEKISNNANTGAYAFTDITVLHYFCKYILDNNVTFNNEPYTSCVISEMIKMNISFSGYELKDDYVFSLGTPLAVQKFIDSRYAFLFDLDGTIVITDDIYFDVWYEILIKYNIILTKEIFKTFIQGNNDKYLLNSFLTNIELSLTELSNLKDELFIKNINKITVNNGIHDVLNEIRVLGHKMCIVTNCNRIVADKIIHYININKFVDFIISSNDCIIGKPNPEPYIKAIQKYNIPNNRCIVFEDSKTGILSGQNVNPRLLVGVETIYNSVELYNIGVNVTIKNFSNLNITNLINNSLNNVKYFKNLIKKNTTIKNCTDVLIDENKLKGGFIADVIGIKIVTNDNVYSVILKYENKGINNLSTMAKSLQLYEREYYFYTHISRHVNISIPMFYNLLVDENFNNTGIVLENLIDKNYKINLNLNTESIDVTLLIVERMAKLHSKFWNKNLKKIFPNLNYSTSKIFCPFFTNFINERYELFKNKWFNTITRKQQKISDEIYRDFSEIQHRFSIGNNLTFIHGDIKSPNIFYDTKNNFEPCFIDWQHCAIGKGVQDLVFFVLESFDIINVKNIFYLIKFYYYNKIIEYGIKNYSFDEYEKDIYDALYYIPFFTSVWFGSTPQDELIDKNFPYFFISKLFYLIEILNDEKAN